jgi:UDP-glucose:(heptosyl)LPS alpha-1,3-glucosyltransferase
VDFSEFDVLLHPAKSEPYGMVICEAMAVQVPVVISDACGASKDVIPESGAILSLDASVDEWVRAIDSQLSRTELPPKFERSWKEVAQEYENILYAMATKMPSHDFSRPHRATKFFKVIV